MSATDRGRPGYTGLDRWCYVLACDDFRAALARNRALADMGSDTCSPGGDVGLKLRVVRRILVVIHCSYGHFWLGCDQSGIDNIDSLIEGRWAGLSQKIREIPQEKAREMRSKLKNKNWLKYSKFVYERCALRSSAKAGEGLGRKRKGKRRKARECPFILFRRHGRHF